MDHSAQDERRPFEVTNRMVFAIAAPMTLAYLTTPILGLVDTGVIGQFGDAVLIGGLAVGAIIFDIVFTTFNFLRAGTTAFVAQAVGRGDETAQQAVFWRAVLLAAVLGVAILIVSPIIREAAIFVMDPGDAVAEATRTYVTIRMLSAPFSLINYALLGLLLGQGRAMAGLLLQTLLNGINIAGSIWFGLVLGWAIEGVALGTVLGEAIAAVLGFWWILRGFDKRLAPSWAVILERTAFLRLISVNRDIMIRSFALLAGFALFTRAGAQFGAVTLAANAILMNFFMIAGYYLDGFATAAEQIVGRSVGARHPPAFWRAVKLTCFWGFALAGFTTVMVLIFGSGCHRHSDDRRRRTRRRADLSRLGGDHRRRRRARLPDGRRLHRRDMVGRHAQHDVAVARHIYRAIAAGAAGVGQSRPVVRAECVSRHPRPVTAGDIAEKGRACVWVRGTGMTNRQGNHQWRPCADGAAEGNPAGE